MIEVASTKLRPKKWFPWILMQRPDRVTPICCWGFSSQIWYDRCKLTVFPTKGVSKTSRLVNTQIWFFKNDHLGCLVGTHRHGCSWGNRPPSHHKPSRTKTNHHWAIIIIGRITLIGHHWPSWTTVFYSSYTPWYIYLPNWVNLEVHVGVNIHHTNSAFGWLITLVVWDG